MSEQIGEQKFEGGQTIVVERVGADGHRYKVYDDEHLADGTVVPSVTRIIAATFAKPALAGWASGIRRDSYEQAMAEYQVYNHTHHLSLSSGGGAIFGDIGARADAIHKVKRTEAADWGKAVHAAAADALNGMQPGGTPQALIGMGVLAWMRAVGIHDIYSEVILYDPHSKFAGTADVIALKAGNAYFADYKATKDFYPEMAVQLGAYANMFRVNRPVGMGNIDVGSLADCGGQILKLPKSLEDSDKVRWVEPCDVNLEQGALTFMQARSLYDYMETAPLWVGTGIDESQEEDE